MGKEGAEIPSSTPMFDNVNFGSEAFA